MDENTKESISIVSISHFNASIISVCLSMFIFSEVPLLFFSEVIISKVPLGEAVI